MWKELCYRMIDCGINYFKDFIQPNFKFKIPNADGVYTKSDR